jgi:anaerobic selenocysteine-containing dehydrogenase
LKAWIERSGNKLATAANTAAWVNSFKNLDLIVHMYMYPTSFSAYADYLLPTTEWLESDLPMGSLNWLFVRREVTHLYETVNETQIWAMLVQRLAELGHKDCARAFDPKETAPQSPYFLTMREQLDDWCKRFGKTWQQCLDQAPFEYLPYDKYRRYYGYKEINPKTGKPEGFMTPSGKVHCYFDVYVELGRTGMPLSPIPLPPTKKEYDALPYYAEPPESPLNEVGKQYPLVLTEGRLPMYHHGTLRNIPYLREIQPVADIWIHPDDAKKYGISQGDWVWVESMRGKTRARTLVTSGIAKGVTYMERFWNPELLGQTNGWQEMNVNMLTRSDPPYNDICGTYLLRGIMVKVSKAAEGAPLGAWIEPEDFEPWMPQTSDPTKIIAYKELK